MTDHEIVWKFHHDYLSQDVACSAPEDAPCQQVPDCDCEEWDLEEDQFGYFHMVNNERHDHKRADYCNVREWLTSYEVLDSAAPGVSLEVARTPIQANWNGLHYEWKPV